MIFFITDYLIGILSLLAILISAFLTPWVQCLAGHLHKVSYTRYVAALGHLRFWCFPYRAAFPSGRKMRIAGLL
jgi:hypothetical protein